MAVRKIAISVPEDVMEVVDRAAARRHTTRSAYISEILRRVASARTDAEITRRIDAVFSDRDVARAQVETAAAFATAEPGAGWEW